MPRAFRGVLFKGKVKDLFRLGQVQAIVQHLGPRTGYFADLYDDDASRQSASILIVERLGHEFEELLDGFSSRKDTVRRGVVGTLRDVSNGLVVAGELGEVTHTDLLTFATWLGAPGDARAAEVRLGELAAESSYGGVLRPVLAHEEYTALASWIASARLAGVESVATVLGRHFELVNSAKTSYGDAQRTVSHFFKFQFGCRPV